MSHRTTVLPREGVMKLHGSTGTWCPVAVLIVALLSACNELSTPMPTPTPPPPNISTGGYRVSGIVIDAESGLPNRERHCRDGHGSPAGIWQPINLQHRKYGDGVTTLARTATAPTHSISRRTGHISPYRFKTVH